MSETREEYNARKKRERANKLPQLAEKMRLARANETPEKRADRLEKAKIKQREWRLKNPDHANTKMVKRKYKQSAKGRAMDSKHRVARRTGLKQATPLWVDMNTIADVYKFALFYDKNRADCYYCIVSVESRLRCTNNFAPSFPN